VQSSEAVGVAAAEAWEQLGNPEEGEYSVFKARKLLLSYGSEDMNLDTNVCV
jgi:hypothetical protein